MSKLAPRWVSSGLKWDQVVPSEGLALPKETAWSLLRPEFFLL